MVNRAIILIFCFLILSAGTGFCSAYTSFEKTIHVKKSEQSLANRTTIFLALEEETSCDFDHSGCTNILLVNSHLPIVEHFKRVFSIETFSYKPMRSRSSLQVLRI